MSDKQFLVTFNGRMICNDAETAESLRIAVDAVVSVWAMDKRSTVTVEPIGENKVIVDADQLLELQRKAGEK